MNFRALLYWMTCRKSKSLGNVVFIYYHALKSPALYFVTSHFFDSIVYLTESCIMHRGLRRNFFLNFCSEMIINFFQKREMQQQPQVDDVLLAPLGFIWHYAKTSLLCMKRYYDPKTWKYCYLTRVKMISLF